MDGQNAAEERVHNRDTLHGFEPSYATFNPIEHYYGDTARELLLGGTILMLLTSPLYADRLTVEFPFEMAGALVAVCFAALTNPWKRWAVMGDAIVAGVAAVIFQGWAILDFSSDNPIPFVFREAIAIVAIFALYFSVKTVRAMVLHQVGKQPQGNEFDGAAKSTRHTLPMPPRTDDDDYVIEDKVQGEELDGE
jgi:hypothetical protein